MTDKNKEVIKRFRKAYPEFEVISDEDVLTHISIMMMTKSRIESEIKNKTEKLSRRNA